jgi:hypothetical protein
VIISDPYRFLYVANLRTASSSIHTALRSVATIIVNETSAGKHRTLTEIYQTYDATHLDALFKWAVVRDPEAFLWSLYQFHKQPAFNGKPISTAAKSFGEFYQPDRHQKMFMPQASRFLDQDGNFGLDFLITLDRLSEGFAYLRFRLGLPNLLLPVTNATEEPAAIPHDLVERIRSDYRSDYECIKEYGNRERTTDGFVKVFAARRAGAGSGD